MMIILLTNLHLQQKYMDKRINKNYHPDDTNRYYVYQYRRKDNSKIIYVGIGTKDFARKGNKKYKRMYQRHVENKAVLFYQDKNLVNYELLLESNNRQDVIDLEISLIKQHGRKNNNTGELYNLTDGGEGVIGHSHSKETILKMKQSQQTLIKENKEKGIVHRTCKKVFAYDKSGKFVGDFASQIIAGKKLNCCNEEISKVVNYNKKCTNGKWRFRSGYYFFEDYRGDYIRFFPFGKETFEIVYDTISSLILDDRNVVLGLLGITSTHLNRCARLNETTKGFEIKRDKNKWQLLLQ
jgi:hypothetical protein